MSEIVERLRALPKMQLGDITMDNWIDLVCATAPEAAAEIEGLRDANEGYQVLVRSLTAEIDRLRSALDKIYRITLAVNALKREPAA